MHFIDLNWILFEKMILLKTVEAKVIIITRYVQSNETMPINTFKEVKVDL